MANSTKSHIPNFRWLVIGVVLGLLFLAKLQGRPGTPMSPGMWGYMLFGLLVACVWAVFESAENGWHVCLLIPIASVFWPFMLMFLLVNKPWNSAKWKSRRSIPEANPTNPPESGDSH